MSKTIWSWTCYLLGDMSPCHFDIVAPRLGFQVVRRWRHRQVPHCKQNDSATKRRGRSVSNCLESLNRRWGVRWLQEVWSNTSRPVSQRVSPRPRHVSLRLRVTSTLKTLNRPSRPPRYGGSYESEFPACPGFQTPCFTRWRRCYARCSSLRAEAPASLRHSARLRS